VATWAKTIELTVAPEWERELASLQQPFNDLRQLTVVLEGVILSQRAELDTLLAALIRDGSSEGLADVA